MNTENPLTNFKTKVELLPILPWYPRLTLEIFIADVFHTIAKASSIIFDLRRQFFAEVKIFELDYKGCTIELLPFTKGE